MSSTEYVTCTELAPLILQISPVDPTTQSVERRFEEVDRILSGGGKTAWLYYLPSGMKMSAAGHRLAGKMLDARKDLFKANAVGVGLFCESKFLLSSFILGNRLPVPYKAGADLPDLLAWLETQLQRAHLALPPAAATKAATFLTRYSLAA